MSLWKLGADDVSQETQNLKDKLASKGECLYFNPIAAV